MNRSMMLLVLSGTFIMCSQNGFSHHHDHYIVVEHDHPHYVVEEVHSQNLMVVHEAPPAILVEDIPSSPGPEYVWIGGSWNWNGRWEWVKGTWGRKPHFEAVWAPTTWEYKDHWVRHEGHWR